MRRPSRAWGGRLAAWSDEGGGPDAGTLLEQDYSIISKDTSNR
jgi:hypothetical protein